MSELLIQKLIDKFSYKEIETFEISGTVNSNGQLTHELSKNFVFKDSATYFVSLDDFSTTSFFSNLSKNENDKFYYYENGSTEIKEFTFYPGAYEIKAYNDTLNIKDIQISISKESGLLIIKLTPGWKVYFNKDKTWRHELGLADEILDKEKNTSTRVADLLKSQKIYIGCDLAKGSYMNGKLSNVIFSFNNVKEYGRQISFTPEKRRYNLLQNKNFNSITFNFFNDKEKPIDFEGALSTICIEIKHV